MVLPEYRGRVLLRDLRERPQDRPHLADDPEDEEAIIPDVLKPPVPCPPCPDPCGTLVRVKENSGAVSFTTQTIGWDELVTGLASMWDGDTALSPRQNGYWHNVSVSLPLEMDDDVGTTDSTYVVHIIDTTGPQGILATENHTFTPGSTHTFTVAAGGFLNDISSLHVSVFRTSGNGTIVALPTDATFTLEEFCSPPISGRASGAISEVKTAFSLVMGQHEASIQTEFSWEIT